MYIIQKLNLELLILMKYLHKYFQQKQQQPIY